MRCVVSLRRMLFQARSVTFHEASLTKVFIAAWENYPRKIFATLAMRYSVFSERLLAPAAASSRNNVFAAHRQGRILWSLAPPPLGIRGPRLPNFIDVFSHLVGKLDMS